MPATAFLNGYESFEQTLPPQPPGIGALRRAGRERFAVLGFPSVRQEAWRHTNVAPIVRSAWARSGPQTPVPAPARLDPLRVPDTIELVFVNGRFVPERSRTDGLPAGVFAGSLAHALAAQPERVVPHLGQHADLDHPFVALNTAHLADGAFVHVPRATVVARPIHLLMLTTAGVVSYPRNLVVVDGSGEVTVIESYAGLDGKQYFSSPVTEIVGGPASMIDHYKLEQEDGDAFHVATQKVHLGRDANFFSHSVARGGALVRNDVQAMLAGEGIHCTLNGLYLGRGSQHIDHQMRVDHAKPHCTSYELYKGILEDRSRAVFNGLIHVHPDAQKTDAKQSNRNLLLSDGALAHSNPQLEIYADDVRCTHGSTTGHLDEQAIFYLRSRGIGPRAARSLLVYSFACEVIKEMRLEAVRKGLEELLFSRLPRGEVVRQAV